jgi:hypothetical protein
MNFLPAVYVDQYGSLFPDDDEVENDYWIVVAETGGLLAVMESPAVATLVAELWNAEAARRLTEVSRGDLPESNPEADLT